MGGCAVKGGWKVKSCCPRAGRVGRKFGARTTTTLAGYAHHHAPHPIHPGLQPVYVGPVASTAYCSGDGVALTKYCITGGAAMGR